MTKLDVQVKGTDTGVRDDVERGVACVSEQRGVAGCGGKGRSGSWVGRR